MKHLLITGFAVCPYFQRACAAARNTMKKGHQQLNVVIKEVPRDQFHAVREAQLRQANLDVNQHTTCPIVFEVDENTTPTRLVGGCDALLDYLVKHFRA